MEITYITTISLVWLVYTFLFADIDAQITDVVNRLKFALSINASNGAVKLELLQAHAHMGIPEIIAYGENMAQVDPKGTKIIENFAEKYNLVEAFKKILMWNLFFLTAHVIVYSFFYISSISFIQVHIIVSLLIGALFYWVSRKELSSLAFSQVTF